MNILFISPYPPMEDGIADYTKKLVDELSRNVNNEIIIVSLKQKKLNNNKVFYTLSFNPLDLLKTYFLLKNKNLSVIHLQYDFSSYMLLTFPILFLLLMLRIFSKTKIVVTFHEAKRDLELYGVFSLVFYRCISIIFHRIYTHTTESLYVLKYNYKINNLKLKLIPHGTYVFKDKNNYSKELVKKFNIDNNKLNLLFFGYIYKAKGIEYLIKATSLLQETNKYKGRFNLIIVGGIRERNGLFKFFEKRNLQYLQTLKLLVKTLGVNKQVKFIGFLKDKYIYSIFKNSDILILPYTSVDQSGVLNIALAAQTPTIASNIGGFKDTLKHSGILVPPKNAVKIFEGIVNLDSNRKLYNKIKKEYKNINLEQSTRNVSLKLIHDYENL